MKTNYRHQKKLREQARLTRQAEKLQRRQAARATELATAAEPAAGESLGGEAVPESSGQADSGKSPP